MNKFFRQISWQIIFAVFLGIFFLRNLSLPIIADDYAYAFIWDGDGLGNLLNGIDANRLQRVESFSDILYSQWQHYFTWGGRTIAHIFVQFFVWQGRIFFDVANIFVFAALVLLIFKVGTGLTLREMNKTYMAFILAGIYFCTPSLIITTVWLTGACNYLWMCTLEILFLLPFALKYWQPKKQFLIPNFTFLIALAALMAGWSIEPGAVATISVASLFVIYFWRKKNLELWMKVGFLFLLIGFALLMLSPGNFHRLEITNAYEPDDIVPPDAQWTPQMFLTNFVVGFLPVFLREAILFVPIIIYFARGKISPVVARFILTFAGASILILLVMLCSPEFPQRAGFPSTIFLLIGSLAALKEILPSVENFFRRRLKLVAILAAFWSLSLLGCLVVEYDLHCQLQARNEFIAAHKNDDLITVKPLEIPDLAEKFLGTRTWNNMTLYWGGDIEPNTKGNRGITFARYHGLKKIVVEEKAFE